eukprot:6720012-Alexandrium_andersonii.AAC.1
MSASLVGSEMCIRDRCSPCSLRDPTHCGPQFGWAAALGWAVKRSCWFMGCLLYTSDAADDM